MEPIVEEMFKAIDEEVFKKPEIPVIQNVNAEITVDPEKNKRKS